VPAIENTRLSTIADELANDKRDSRISTTSSNSATAKSKRKTHVGPWQLGKTLGKGATGRVRLAKHSTTGQVAAVKIVSKKSAALVQSASMARMDSDETNQIIATGPRTMPFGIEREVVIMKLIEHPNVITLYDIWENRGELYLVLEHVEGGELFDYVSSNGALPEDESVRLFRQIIAGLTHCHHFNICHRDLKPENILLDKQRNVKLADFGMAALQPDGRWLNTSCGSPHYAAPEIINGLQYRGDKADIWSTGVILYAMLNGFLPFDGGDISKTLALVRKGGYHLPPSLSVEAADLIQRILQRRPDKRIEMKEIWSHPLLRKYERFYGNDAISNSAPGRQPPLDAINESRRITRRSDIDPEVLRNLSTLWHGEKQSELIRRLMSDTPNHEKLSTGHCSSFVRNSWKITLVTRFNTQPAIIIMSPNQSPKQPRKLPTPEDMDVVIRSFPSSATTTSRMVTTRNLVLLPARSRRAAMILIEPHALPLLMMVKLLVL
jgi:serine/threonine protein kinase